MPDNEWNEMLVAATGEVLETMFFTGAYGPAQAGIFPAEPHVVTRVAFEGTPSGSLAANFLASEDDVLPRFAQLGGGVCELANRIRGSLLSRVKTEEHFRLSSPELLPDGAACPPGELSQSLALGEGLGDGTVDLWLESEHHAG